MLDRSSEFKSGVATDFSPGILDHRFYWGWTLPILALLVLFPFIALAFKLDFYLAFVSRILVFALIVTSLNLILGFGGMVSFGHAAFVGLGAYSVGILMSYGVVNAYLVWPLAVLIAFSSALLVGAISLRTKGVYFIMITLAFAQMFFYLVSSIKLYGGDDGLTLNSRSFIGFGIDLNDDKNLYFIVLTLLVVVLYTLIRLLNSQFGHALQAIRENEERMISIGFPVYRYKLLAFAIAGGLAGLGGVLLANLNGFVSPALMQWTQSGMMLIMVILGGVGYVYGGVFGAFSFLLIEEFLSEYTIHWQLGLGLALLGVVLYLPNGLASMLEKKSR